jgi:GntR family transcriptional regulator, transcriptional repressor for pyruvate dehydrogenase complex
MVKHQIQQREPQSSTALSVQQKGAGVQPVVTGRQKLSDILFFDLQARISDGRLMPEVRLPSEHELSMQFGVSRPIVREGLRRLREAGLISSRQGSGSFVSKAPPKQLAPDEIKGAPVEPFVSKITSVADVRRVFEFRIHLEGGSAFTAAQNRSAAHLEAIRRELSALDLALERGELGVKQDVDLHAAIVAATQNRFSEQAFAAISGEIFAVIDLTRTLSGGRALEYRAKMQQEHRLIVSHIEDRNPSAARECMQAHLRDAQERLFAEIHV